MQHLVDSNTNVYNTAYEYSMFISVVFIFVGGGVVCTGGATVVVGLLLPLSSTKSVVATRIHRQMFQRVKMKITRPVISTAATTTTTKYHQQRISPCGTFTPTTHEISNSELYLFTYIPCIAYMYAVCSCSYIMYSYSLQLKFELISIWNYSQNIKQSNLPQIGYISFYAL